MPASTSDPISSVLQRTFGDHKKEGLIRGGNSSSARPFSFIDQKLQASSKHSLLGGIQFDAPTRTDVSPSGGCKTPTQQRVIVLNPQLKVEASGKNGSEQASENGSSNSSAAIPQPKVTNGIHFRSCCYNFYYSRLPFSRHLKLRSDTPRSGPLVRAWPMLATLVT